MSFGIDDAIGAGLQIINKFVPDPDQRAKAESALRDSLQVWDKSQSDVNAVEAANANVFVSGWRPFIGWTCGLALAYQFVAAPIFVWVGLCFGFHPPVPPKLDDTLWQLVFAMLGMGGLRTLEKLKGVAR